MTMTRKRHTAVHHPFTAPNEDQLELLGTDPGKVKSRAYDLVLNGNEIGGGSIRVHQKDMQEKIFQVLGIAQQEAEKNSAFSCGPWSSVHRRMEALHLAWID